VISWKFWDEVAARRKRGSGSRQRGAFIDGIRFRLAESYAHSAQSLKIKSWGILRFHRNFSEQPIEF
jgi:hypothetical protein